MKNLIKSTRPTKIDDGYATCEHTYCEFVVDCVVPPQIFSKETGLDPSYSQTKNQLIRNTLGRERIAKKNIWILSSENVVPSRDIRRHLDWLLAKIYPARNALFRLREESVSFAYVNCIWHSNGAGGPTLWPEQMSLLAELDLELTFSLYLSDDTEGLL